VADTEEERLREELARALAELEDLEELKGAFLGQTGVHIGRSDRHRYEQEEVELKERIALLEKRLEVARVNGEKA
jgi:hypothetical protein